MCILLYRSRSLQSYEFFFRRTFAQAGRSLTMALYRYMVVTTMHIPHITFTENFDKHARCLNHSAYVRGNKTAINVLISFLFILDMLIYQVQDIRHQKNFI